MTLCVFSVNERSSAGEANLFRNRDQDDGACKLDYEWQVDGLRVAMVIPTSRLTH
jgi:hypothetical protein